MLVSMKSFASKDDAFYEEERNAALQKAQEMEMARKKAIPGMISPADAMSNMTQATAIAQKWYYTEWDVDFGGMGSLWE